jgi:hypothetical protein
MPVVIAFVLGMLVVGFYPNIIPVAKDYILEAEGPRDKLVETLKEIN